MPVQIISPQRQDVQLMIHQADAVMLDLYPPDSNHLDDISELVKPNVCFVGGFINEQLAGIGAVKIQNDDGVYGEIKRVYVDPNFRGQRLAFNIMAFLENHLVEQNVFIARLETGDKQIEAIRLYQNLGYQISSPYGKYRADPLSVFMQKTL